MTSPVIQFKRGVLNNLLVSGRVNPVLQPTLTTSMWVLIPQPITTNSLVLKDSGTLVLLTAGSGVKLVEGTNNGTSAITLKSPPSLGGDVTYVMLEQTVLMVTFLSLTVLVTFRSPLQSSISHSPDSGSNDTFSLYWWYSDLHWW